MATSPIAVDLERYRAFNARETLVKEVQQGLLRRPRSLPPWMFYDARGSRIFERITQLAEYYPTRTERKILSRYANDIIAATCPERSKAMRVVELGAGTGTKTALLLEAAARRQSEVLYVPVDVSPAALDTACEALGLLLPGIGVAPIVANYVTHPPELGAFEGTTLGLYIGSSIGNFDPAGARAILRNLGSQLQAGDALLLGVDMVKDESILVSAYDDREGVTAEFNLNLLRRLNRELGADFPLTGFVHRALWNPIQSRIEMHLESTREQQVHIPAANLNIRLAKGERIHTENSYKFTDETLGDLLADAGFEVERTWADERGWYSVTLARVR